MNVNSQLMTDKLTNLAFIRNSVVKDKLIEANKNDKKNLQVL